MCSQDEDNEKIQVSNEMANRMSLFYAYPTPLLKTLSDATSKFVTEVCIHLAPQFKVKQSLPQNI